MVMNSLVVKIVCIVIIRIINTSYDISIHVMGDQLEKKGDKQTPILSLLPDTGGNCLLLA